MDRQAETANELKALQNCTADVQSAYTLSLPYLDMIAGYSLWDGLKAS
jgi:hypothetical protein